jgi:gamma-glutamyltranspeptidase/glutathione hydrolase
VNVIAPRKRTMHTLIPAMAFRGSSPWLVFGTMGGHGQAQTHLQLVARFVDEGLSPTEAIGAPRWTVSPLDWSVVVEQRDARAIEELRARGHRVRVTNAYDGLMGHAHAIRVDGPTYAAASDPRSEGAAFAG